MHAGRVLYVEDEESIAEPLSELLRLDGYEVAVAGTIAEALQAMHEIAPDIVLLDQMLPDGSGRDFCRALRRESSEVPIIFVTARGDPIDRIVGLEIGADDYVVKPVEGAEISARIAAILRRTRRVAEGAEPALADAAAVPLSGGASLAVGDLRVDLECRRVWRGDTEIALSLKEFDLLALLARKPGRVVRREEFMAEVWDTNWWGSTRTLDVHIGSLRGKLGDTGRGRPRLIQTVRGVGFRLCPPEA